MHTVLAPVVLLLVSNATAQGTPLPRNTVIPPATWDAAITEGKQKSQVMAILDHLCNRIGPRLTSSDNLQNACEWSREWLKDLGYDNARLDRWGEFPVGFNRGPWSGEVLAPIKKALVCNTPAWSAGTHGRQEGPLVLAPTSEEDAKERATELQGAWLLMKQRPRRSLSGRARRITKACQEAGALGYVYSGRKTRNGMKKGIVHENLLLTGGNYRIRWNKLPAFPRVQVRWDQFQELVAMLEKRQEVRLAFDIRNWFKKGPIPLYNVVADLVGSEKPNEFVVVSGHIDSWDGAAGTTDNGTGTATTLEAARILKAIGARPKRTIRFMLWSGEEQGLMGSRSWVQKNRKDVKVNCQAALVHDGGTNYAGGIVGTKAQLPLLLRAFAGFHTIDSSLPFQVTEGRQPSYGSDHTSFISIGAPGFYWKQEGNAQYRYTHHTQYDTFDAAVPAYQAQTALVAALGALALANLDERIPSGPRPARNRVAMARFQGELSDKMVVKSVEDGGLAKMFGLMKGDKLLALDGSKLANEPGKFRRTLRDLLRSGKTMLELQVRRKGKKIMLKLNASRRGKDEAKPTGPKRRRR